MIRPPPALIALTPGDVRERDIDSVVRLFQACVRAGLRGVLVREPGLSDRATLELARRLRDVVHDGWLCVHDRVHLAPASGADAVHLGWRSLTPVAARAVVPAALRIGFSAHAGDEARLAEGADYLFFGPVKDTPSKRGIREPTGFDALAQFTRAVPEPVWALGGMEPVDVETALAASAAGVAVLGGIVRAPDPARACAAYVEAWNAHASRSAGG
ncbi:MAG: thiamine phosphate synthase [Planctomycetes bacterium]|nr:thiamine phosphate synthase [Planctomycetota bacterium]